MDGLLAYNQLFNDFVFKGDEICSKVNLDFIMARMDYKYCVCH